MHACMHRKAEDESRIESLEVARTALEEKLRLVEAKKMKLEQRVSALTKQNASLAKAASQPVPSLLSHTNPCCQVLGCTLTSRSVYTCACKLLSHSWQHVPQRTLCR